MKSIRLLLFMIAINSSPAHAVSWILDTEAGRLGETTSNFTSVGNENKIPRFKFLKVADSCNNNYKFGVVIMHGSIKGNAARGELSGTKKIEAESSTNLKPLMEWFQRGDVCAFVIAPNASLKANHLRRWDTNDTLTGAIERRKLNNLIERMTPYALEGVFLMGGSSGAIMAHNVSLNAINEGNTSNMEGVVIVDGISAKQLCYTYPLYPGVSNDQVCPWWNTVPERGDNTFIDTWRIEATGLTNEKSWTLPTLVLYADPDKSIGVDLKKGFAEALADRGQGTVRILQAGSGHAGDAWLKGTGDIINGIRGVLSH